MTSFLFPDFTKAITDKVNDLLQLKCMPCECEWLRPEFDASTIDPGLSLETTTTLVKRSSVAQSCYAIASNGFRPESGMHAFVITVDKSTSVTVGFTTHRTGRSSIMAGPCLTLENVTCSMRAGGSSSSFAVTDTSFPLEIICVLRIHPPGWLSKSVAVQWSVNHQALDWMPCDSNFEDGEDIFPFVVLNGTRGQKVETSQNSVRCFPLEAKIRRDFAESESHFVAKLKLMEDELANEPAKQLFLRSVFTNYDRWCDEERDRIVQEFTAALSRYYLELYSLVLDSLAASETAERAALSAVFCERVSQLVKFNWFFSACHTYKITFPGEWTYEKVVDEILMKEDLDRESLVSDVMTAEFLRNTLKLNGGVITRFLELKKHLLREKPRSRNADSPLAVEVKQKLQGVHFIPFDELDFGTSTEIGSGGFGSVFKVKIRFFGHRACAAKLFRDKDIAFREANNILPLDHPHILRIVGVSVDDSANIILLSELADCDFSKYLNNITANLSLAAIRDFAEQICSGLEYLHRQDTEQSKERAAHLDLKPANILLFPEPLQPCGYTVKIGDLGSAQHMKDSSSVDCSSVVGTDNYLPPETRYDRIQKRCNPAHRISISTTIDVFAFGIILLQLIAPNFYAIRGRSEIAAKSGFAIHNPSLFVTEAETCVGDFSSEVGPCDDLVKLVKDCLMLNKKKRPQNGYQLLQRSLQRLLKSDFEVATKFFGAEGIFLDNDVVSNNNNTDVSVDVQNDGIKYGRDPPTNNKKGSNLHPDRQSLATD